MGLLSRLKTNVEDVVKFGPSFLLRHYPRLTRSEMASVHMRGVGAIYLRAGQSDVAAVRQIFGNEEYNIGAIPPIGLRLCTRYRAILRLVANQ